MSFSRDQRPKVVFTLSDDQGPWAAGCCGNPEIRTPPLDRLAATDTRFSRFFVATPVCLPIRAPEPGQQGRIRELKAQMDEWFARYVEAEYDGLKEWYEAPLPN